MRQKCISKAQRSELKEEKDWISRMEPLKKKDEINHNFFYIFKNMPRQAVE